MRETLTTFVVATALTASAFAVSAQEQTTPETGEMMQNEGAMQGGMMDGDMMGMMKMMAEMKPMMEACTEMMASMTENMDGGMMPSEKSDG
ncbi:hypothetical protein ACRARG_19050 [Pseudooceanicola sp. C21-150M6]|jgi:hypothetical protein|uniref:Pentapeptide MXKDX repeat protein n=2 Tax=Rhodobacterales TaxID=204455 RepID=A0A1G8U3C4_9RHOB|nr:hypothetical protein [Salipiger marinus]SDJ48326.1 hypothetical protein SAMN04487993_103538 [Salipiger marinus]|tara:strand:- start:394 stop:666 length:273 start_codon:yes stop_codon:yes gene_type:complete